MAFHLRYNLSVFLSFIILTLLAVVLMTAPTHAASDYDDVIYQANSLKLPDYYDNEWHYETDVGTSYTSYLTGNALSDFNATTSSENGQWAVFGTNDYIYIVFGQVDLKVNPIIGSNGPAFVLNEGTYGLIRYYKENGNIVQNYFENQTSTFYIYNGTKPDPIPPYGGPYLVNIHTNYPDGYSGETMPQGANIPNESDAVPNFYASTSLDYKVSIHDKNFNTFDGIQWTCSEDGNSIIEGGEGFAPVLYWQIWRNDTDPNVLIEDGYQSATAQIDVQLPKVDETREYRIAGWYECGGTVDFTDAANFTFQITQNGLLGETNLLESCFTETFPFLDIPGCINNLGIVIGMLSFNAVTYNNEWNPTESCYNLTVIDDWLNLQNPTVCPKIPSAIRNITTPFITFALGLVTITFLAKNKGSDW